MNRSQPRLLPLLLIGGLAVALAAPATYDVDPAHSSVTFEIGHLGIARIHGRFDQTEGTFVYDEAEPSNSKVDLTVQADSLYTGVQQRDDHVRSADFLDVEQYPTITFESTGVKRISRNIYAVQGDLTLHGTTKPITVHAVKTGEGEGMNGEWRAGFTTTFSIRRSDYGVDFMIPAVSDRMLLTVSLEGIRQDGA